MTSAKDTLREKFSADPDRYYRVALFNERGFIRKKCPSCGKFFWTLNEKQVKCPSPPCTVYGFIGKPPVRGWKKDYIGTWKAIEKFFEKNGHTSVPSYPTVCRWFPGLYFTIASVIAVQRSVAGKTVFELPHNPMVIPQTSLRFNDIPNVGVSGRHMTSFVMIGQLAQQGAGVSGGYWKDECIDLDWRLLTEVLKIPEHEISFMEDIWVGPAAFGYSLEYYVRGLELGNAVFTEFVGTVDNYKTMEPKLIDMGAGLERMLWVMQGTPTCYDSAYGEIAKKLKKKIDYDPAIFKRYASAAAVLDLEFSADIDKAKCAVADHLKIKYDKLKKSTEQLEALYAIIDHAKTLLYAITDGQLPSNVGGGYNLRVILRRALSFIDEFDLDIDLFEVCRMHAKYLQKLDERLANSLDEVEEIIDVEAQRFKETRKRAVKIVENELIRSQKLTDEKLIQLYESHGVTPELVKEVAKTSRKAIEIPADFYRRMTERHIQEKPEDKKEALDLSNLPPTRLLFYENEHQKEFSAKVLRVIDNKFVVVNQTCFFARTGGQEPDHGALDGSRVYDVNKHGKIVVHTVENCTLKEGDMVFGRIDWERRIQIMMHHTATHIINGATRKILGSHAWQCGALKEVEKARLDMTHYAALTEEQIEAIEELANKVVKSGVTAKKHILPRLEAERRFGFGIYQGGAIPLEELRIMEIPEFDIEACGGTHIEHIGELGEIVIIGSERIQDGVIRLNFVAGPAAERERQRQKMLVQQAAKVLDVDKNKLLVAAKELSNRWKKARHGLEKLMAQKAKAGTTDMVAKIKNNALIEIVEGDREEVQALSRALSDDDRLIILFGVHENKINVWIAAGARSGYHAGDIAKHVCGELGGRGGGSPLLGQGFGTKQELLRAVAEKLRKKYQG